MRDSSLLTGATGFVGTHLLRSFRNAGQMPRLAVRDILRLEALFPDYPGPKVHWDLNDPGNGSIRCALEGVQAVVHAAANVVGGADFSTCAPGLMENVRFGLHLIAALPRECRHIVFLSSTAVYGDPNAPVIDEEHPTLPVDFYGIAKLATEKFLLLYGREQHKTVTILRISSVYGPGMPAHRAIPKFIDAVLAGRPVMLRAVARAKRNYIHVGDVAAAVLRCLVAGEAAGGVFNICAEIPVSLSDMLKIVESHTGKRAERLLEPGAEDKPMLQRNYSVAKAQRVFGFNESTSIAEGLRQLCARSAGQV